MVPTKPGQTFLLITKLYNYRVNSELSKAYTKRVSSLIWTIPVISEPTIFEFQFYNSLNMPISWTLKYDKCIKCTLEENNNEKNNYNKNYSIFSNKCEHYKIVQITPPGNLKVI